MNNSLLDNFNTSETVVVLSSFPDTNKAEMSAIDRYTEQKFTDIASMRKVVVCAETINEQNESAHIHKDNFLISRIWKKGSIPSLFALLKFILKLDKVKTVFVEFEFNVYGGTLPNFALLCLLFILKVMGKRVVFELHQVITDIAKLDNHLNIHNVVLQQIFSFGIRIFYLFLGIATHQIIVLEEELKGRLSSMVPSRKITVLPHHMNIKSTIDILKAKEKVGIPSDRFTILVFGYLNWYKGVDWIVKVSQNWTDRKIHLVIAGGPNPYHKDKQYYRTYFEKFLKSMKGRVDVTYSGFVDEQDIGLYFSAADLVILPYRVFMAASGPFSLALSYSKPVILSRALTDYSKSSDFTDAMKQARLDKKSLFFSLSGKGLFSMIEKIKSNASYYKKLVLFSQFLAEKRSGKNVTTKLLDVLFPKTNKRIGKASLAIR